MTKREAAVKVVEALRAFRALPAGDSLPLDYRSPQWKEVCRAADAFDAAPDDEEDVRKTKAQSMADEYDPEFLKEIAIEGEQGLGAHVVPILLIALRDDLKALAASVKERR